jgi:hypothetical protein
MRRKKQTAKKQSDDLDKWLHAVDELLESMIMSAGPAWETRRALGEIFVNKAHRVLVEREQPTVH